MKPYNITLHFKVHAETAAAAVARLAKPDVMDTIDRTVQSVAARVDFEGMLPTSAWVGTPDRIDWRCLVEIREAD